MTAHARRSTPSLVLCELADTTATLGVESASPFCVKAHRALRLAGLPYERRHGSRPSSFARYNPAGQVPVLLVDDEPVADSTRILERIDAMTGVLTRGLDARARAESLLWEELADGSLNGFLVAARWADDRNWRAVREAYFAGMPWPVRAVVVPQLRRHVVQRLVVREVWSLGPEACWARFEEVLDQLEARAPSSGYWVAATPAAADLALFGQLHGLRTKLTKPQAESLARRRLLSAYLDRVDAVTSGKGEAGREKAQRPRAEEGALPS